MIMRITEAFLRGEGGGGGGGGNEGKRETLSGAKVIHCTGVSFMAEAMLC